MALRARKDHKVVSQGPGNNEDDTEQVEDEDEGTLDDTSTYILFTNAAGMLETRLVSHKSSWSPSHKRRGQASEVGRTSERIDKHSNPSSFTKDFARKEDLSVSGPVTTEGTHPSSNQGPGGGVAGVFITPEQKNLEMKAPGLAGQSQRRQTSTTGGVWQEAPQRPEIRVTPADEEDEDSRGSEDDAVTTTTTTTCTTTMTTLKGTTQWTKTTIRTIRDDADEDEKMEEVAVEVATPTTQLPSSTEAAVAAASAATKQAFSSNSDPRRRRKESRHSNKENVWNVEKRIMTTDSPEYHPSAEQENKKPKFELDTTTQTTQYYEQSRINSGRPRSLHLASDKTSNTYLYRGNYGEVSRERDLNVEDSVVTRGIDRQYKNTDSIKPEHSSEWSSDLSVLGRLRQGSHNVETEKGYYKESQNTFGDSMASSGVHWQYKDPDPEKGYYKESQNTFGDSMASSGVHWQYKDPDPEKGYYKESQSTFGDSMASSGVHWQLKDPDSLTEKGYYIDSQNMFASRERDVGDSMASGRTDWQNKGPDSIKPEHLSQESSELSPPGRLPQGSHNDETKHYYMDSQSTFGDSMASSGIAWQYKGSDSMAEKGNYLDSQGMFGDSMASREKDLQYKGPDSITEKGNYLDGRGTFGDSMASRGTHWQYKGPDSITEKDYYTDSRGTFVDSKKKVDDYYERNERKEKKDEVLLKERKKREERVEDDYPFKVFQRIDLDVGREPPHPLPDQQTSNYSRATKGGEDSGRVDCSSGYNHDLTETIISSSSLGYQSTDFSSGYLPNRHPDDRAEKVREHWSSTSATPDSYVEVDRGLFDKGQARASEWTDSKANDKADLFEKDNDSEDSSSDLAEDIDFSSQLEESNGKMHSGEDQRLQSAGDGAGEPSKNGRARGTGGSNDGATPSAGSSPSNSRKGSKEGRSSGRHRKRKHRSRKRDRSKDSQNSNDSSSSSNPLPQMSDERAEREFAGTPHEDTLNPSGVEGAVGTSGMAVSVEEREEVDGEEIGGEDTHPSSGWRREGMESPTLGAGALEQRTAWTPADSGTGSGERCTVSPRADHLQTGQLPNLVDYRRSYYGTDTDSGGVGGARGDGDGVESDRDFQKKYDREEEEGEEEDISLGRRGDGATYPQGREQTGLNETEAVITSAGQTFQTGPSSYNQTNYNNNSNNSREDYKENDDPNSPRFQRDTRTTPGDPIESPLSPNKTQFSYTSPRRSNYATDPVYETGNPTESPLSPKAQQFSYTSAQSQNYATDPVYETGNPTESPLSPKAQLFSYTSAQSQNYATDPVYETGNPTESPLSPKAQLFSYTSAQSQNYATDPVYETGNPTESPLSPKAQLFSYTSAQSQNYATDPVYETGNPTESPLSPKAQQFSYTSAPSQNYETGNPTESPLSPKAQQFSYTSAPSQNYATDPVYETGNPTESPLSPKAQLFSYTSAPSQNYETGNPTESPLSPKTQQFSYTSAPSQNNATNPVYETQPDTDYPNATLSPLPDKKPSPSMMDYREDDKTNTETNVPIADNSNNTGFNSDVVIASTDNGQLNNDSNAGDYSSNLEPAEGHFSVGFNNTLTSNDLHWNEAITAEQRDANSCDPVDQGDYECQQRDGTDSTEMNPTTSPPFSTGFDKMDTSDKIDPSNNMDSTNNMELPYNGDSPDKIDSPKMESSKNLELSYNMDSSSMDPSNKQETSNNMELSYNMDSPNQIGSPNNMDPSYNLNSPSNMDPSNNMESSFNMDSSKEIDSPKMESSNTPELSYNIDSPNSLKYSNNVNIFNNMDSPYNMDSPKVDSLSNMGSPNTMDSPNKMDSSNNLESSYNVNFSHNMDSPNDIYTSNNMSSPNKIDSPNNMESSKNMDSSYNLNSLNNMESSNNMDSSYNLNSPNNMESSYNLNSPNNMESSKNMDSSYNLNSPNNMESSKNIDSSYNLNSPNNMESSKNMDSSYNIYSYNMDSPNNLESSDNMDSPYLKSSNNIYTNNNMDPSYNMDSLKDMENSNNMDSPKNMDSPNNVDSSYNIYSYNMNSSDTIDSSKNMESSSNKESNIKDYTDSEGRSSGDRWFGFHGDVTRGEPLTSLHEETVEVGRYTEYEKPEDGSRVDAWSPTGNEGRYRRDDSRVEGQKDVEVNVYCEREFDQGALVIDPPSHDYEERNYNQNFCGGSVENTGEDNVYSDGYDKKDDLTGSREYTPTSDSFSYKNDFSKSDNADTRVELDFVEDYSYETDYHGGETNNSATYNMADNRYDDAAKQGIENESNEYFENRQEEFNIDSQNSDLNYEDEGVNQVSPSLKYESEPSPVQWGDKDYSVGVRADSYGPTEGESFFNRSGNNFMSESKEYGGAEMGTGVEAVYEESSRRKSSSSTLESTAKRPIDLHLASTVFSESSSASDKGRSYEQPQQPMSVDTNQGLKTTTSPNLRTTYVDMKISPGYTVSSPRETTPNTSYYSPGTGAGNDVALVTDAGWSERVVNPAVDATTSDQQMWTPEGSDMERFPVSPQNGRLREGQLVDSRGNYYEGVYLDDGIGRTEEIVEIEARLEDENFQAESLTALNVTPVSSVPDVGPPGVDVEEEIFMVHSEIREVPITPEIRSGIRALYNGRQLFDDSRYTPMHEEPDETFSEPVHNRGPSSWGSFGVHYEVEGIGETRNNAVEETLIIPSVHERNTFNPYELSSMMGHDVLSPETPSTEGHLMVQVDFVEDRLDLGDMSGPSDSMRRSGGEDGVEDDKKDILADTSNVGRFLDTPANAERTGKRREFFESSKSNLESPFGVGPHVERLRYGVRMRSGRAATSVGRKKDDQKPLIGSEWRSLDLKEFDDRDGDSGFWTPDTENEENQDTDTMPFGFGKKKKATAAVNDKTPPPASPQIVNEAEKDPEPKVDNNITESEPVKEEEEEGTQDNGHQDGTATTTTETAAVDNAKEEKETEKEEEEEEEKEEEEVKEEQPQAPQDTGVETITSDAVDGGTEETPEVEQVNWNVEMMETDSKDEWSKISKMEATRKPEVAMTGKQEVVSEVTDNALELVSVDSLLDLANTPEIMTVDLSALEDDEEVAILDRLSMLGKEPTEETVVEADEEPVPEKIVVETPAPVVENQPKKEPRVESTPLIGKQSKMKDTQPGFLCCVIL